jgi:uncharacterized membrane protein
LLHGKTQPPADVSSLILALLRRIVVGAVTQFVERCIQVETDEQIVDSFSTHLGNELIRIGIFEILIIFRKIINNIQILLFREKSY